MGLDVHWGLQKIYDHLYDTHGINSFDDAGVPINAYVRFGVDKNSRDNAFWDRTVNVLLFGQGKTDFRPLASIDVVGHEFGHGITDFQIGWSGTFDQSAFNEGMSDIWAAIFEQRIRPSSTWHIGEQIMLTASYLRNIQNTNDSNAFSQIANTYLSPQYNNAINQNDSFYIRSGIFSHWFYILVNGKGGINDIGNNYSVNGIGMDLAEELIVEAVFNNYLDNTKTYPEIRQAFINAAKAIFCESSQEVKSVTDAWYAVGVGNAYQDNIISISGSDLICSSSTLLTVNNLPSGATINWTSSPTITLTSLQGSNPGTFSTNSNSDTGWIKATITLLNGCDVVINKNVSLGTPSIMSVTFTNSVNDYDHLCSSDTGNMYNIGPEYSPNTTYQYRLLKLPSFNVVYTSLPGRPQSDEISFFLSQGWYEFQFRATNSCGTGPWIGQEVEYKDCTQSGTEEGEYHIFPNPSSSIITIEKNKDKRINTTNEYKVNTLSTYQLFDFNANIITSGDITDITTINVSNYRKGIYILKISLKDRSESHKVIIE